VGKNPIKLLLALKEGQHVFFSTKNIIDDEEHGLTFSRRFCLPKLSVEKVGENSNCDSSFRFFYLKMCLLSWCNVTSFSFNGNPL